MVVWTGGGWMNVVERYVVINGGGVAVMWPASGCGGVWQGVSSVASLWFQLLGRKLNYTVSR